MTARWALIPALLGAAALLPIRPLPPHPAGPSKGSASDSSFAAHTFRRSIPPRELGHARGQILYTRYCAVCHGAGGGGDGFNAYNVRTTFGCSPTAFASLAPEALPESLALRTVELGGPGVGKSAAMPPWGRTLVPSDLDEVAEYARARR